MPMDLRDHHPYSPSPPWGHTIIWCHGGHPNACSWLVVGYSILSHPLSTGVETTATTAYPRNGVPSLKH